jgi:biopolymer transport protein ExbB/TolQ
MAVDDDALARRLEALERAIEKRFDDWSAIHRHEHDAFEDAHTDLHRVEEKHRDEARDAMNERLKGMNEIRAQLNTQAATFQTLAAAGSEDKALHGRIDEMRERIVAIEKGDVKQEGRGLGQSATVAIIVGAIGLVGTILGIIVVLANLATKGLT